MLGLGSGAAAVSFESNPGDGAALVDLRVGYGLNRIVTPYLGGAYADIRSPGLEAAAGAARAEAGGEDGGALVGGEASGLAAAVRCVGSVRSPKPLKGAPGERPDRHARDNPARNALRSWLDRALAVPFGLPVPGFVERYNRCWRLEKLAYRTPVEAREEHELRQTA